MFLLSFLVSDSHNNIYIAMEIMAEKNEKLDPRSFIAIGDTLSNISSFCDCLLGVDIMYWMMLWPINLFCTTFFSYFCVGETINDSYTSRICDKQHRRANWKLIPMLIMLFVSRNKQSFPFSLDPLPRGCGCSLQGPEASLPFYNKFFEIKTILFYPDRLPARGTQPSLLVSRHLRPCRRVRAAEDRLGGV